MIKTRFCLISDTHARAPFPPTDTEHGYRLPLPSADVLLHAGDLTTTGKLDEYKVTLDMLKAADAGLKIVIAGNHDLTLDADYYLTHDPDYWQNVKADVDTAKALWTSEEARTAGVVYLEEGLNKFELKNGATFTIYSSPYTPEYGDWGFPYKRDEDRFNPPQPDSRFKAPNPIPSWPAVDIMLTHGPPHGILDFTFSGQSAGCENLMTAVKRVRPRMHVFGHIHEGRDTKRYAWSSNASDPVLVSEAEDAWDKAAFADYSAEGEGPLRFGEETVFVNAAIMTLQYKPWYVPWVVDLDLPSAANSEI
ncbi:hypothetical protein MMC30_003529 [Trapelia coarctata]|nr:hypothetical protein [Trapelia coarctata]